MKKHIIYLIALGLVLVIGCQKEVSFETGGSPSKGSLQSDASGDCLPKTVNGAYIAGTPLVAATNTITVQVNVTTAGSYLVYTDTVNGYFFRATGSFTALGANTVTLRSNGTPFAARIDNFVVNYDTTFCDIQVTVLPAGTGPAVFTLAGSPSCTTPAIAGTYALTTPLTAANTVTLNVNVTTAGTYNVSTAPPVGGMTFAGSGVLATGPQTIVLTGSGTPTVGGNNTIPVTVGSSTCSFVINVAGPAVGTLGGGPAPGACTPSQVYGTYSVGTALNAGDTVHVQINVTTAGVYNITSNTVTGFSFAGSGTAVSGLNTIKLTATGGPPTTAGPQTFTVTFGTSTCTFVVNVTGTVPAVFTLSGGPAPGACTPSQVYGTYSVGTILNAGDTVHIQINVTTAGTYSFGTNTVAGFSFAASGTAVLGLNTITLIATGLPPTTAGAQTFTVSAGGTCTFVVTVAAAPAIDYFPRTTNSNWSYEFDDDPTDSLYRNVIAAIKNTGTNTYNIFMMNDGFSIDSSGYYRKSGGDYFEWFDANYFIGYDEPPEQWVEYIMLKDNVAAATNWKSAGYTGTVTIPPNPPQSLTIRFSYTILQKDVPVSITTSTGTVNYTNVIVVEEKYEQFTGGVWVDITSIVGYGKSYYARGVGLIKFESFDNTGALNYQMELRRSQVF